MAGNNKLFTKSYFIKRLIEKKFYIQKIVDKYKHGDYRYWTVLVNPERDNIFITCLKTGDKCKFRFYGSNDVNIIVETESMDVIITTLMNLRKNSHE